MSVIRAGRIRWYTWIALGSAVLFLWDPQRALSVIFYGIPTLGFLFPFFTLLVTVISKPPGNVSDRHATTNKAYSWLRGVAWLSSLFALLLLGTLVSLLGEVEWQLGLGLVWELLGVPLQALILFVAFRGLVLVMRSERHLELRVISVCTAFFFLLSASPSQLPIPVNGDYWPYINLPVIVPYPIVCFIMIRRGLKRLVRESITAVHFER